MARRCVLPGPCDITPSMKFGLFSVVGHYPASLERSVGQFYKELLGQCRLADELGFDSFWIAEHHFHEYGVVPRPAVLMAAAAQVTKWIALGAAVVVLPFDNPLRSAEDFAMVDILSGGRLKLGVGSGYLKHVFAAFGIDGSEKRERFDEALSILLKAWKGEPFSFTGTFNKIAAVVLNVVPLQKTPAEVLRVASRYEKAGLNEFLAIANFGGAPSEKVNQSLSMMAEHVLPQLQKQELAI